MASKRRWGTAVLSALGAGCLVLSVVTGVEQRESRGWPQTAGTVVKTDIALRHDPGQNNNLHTTYEPVITYDYTVGDQTFQGTRIAIVSSSYRDKAGAEAVVRRYAVGMPVSVFTRPGDPAFAVLETGGSLAFPVGVALGGLVLLFFALMEWRSNQAATAPSEPDPAELEWKRAEYEARKAARAQAVQEASETVLVSDPAEARSLAAAMIFALESSGRDNPAQVTMARGLYNAKVSPALRDLFQQVLQERQQK